VQHGAADMGIAGKDVLLEHGANGLFELLDLNIAQCKLSSLSAISNPAFFSNGRVCLRILPLDNAIVNIIYTLN
jgi:ATP phosphoribosyltransferase